MNDVVAKYVDNKSQNLLFFQQNYPGIYEYFASYQLSQYKVDILIEKEDIDLLIDGQHLYKGQARSYAKHEIASFLSVFDHGSKIHSIRPLEKNTYKNSRFFAHLLSSIQYYYFQDEPKFEGYQLDDFIPMVVMMGVGLGYHVDYLSKTRDIQQMIVFENDMDKFAASMYVVDWRAIVESFTSKPGGSFTFLLANNTNSVQDAYAVLWNELIKHTPVFPVTTLFYNHLANPLFDRVTNKVNSDLYVHLYSFGNFDDELNQLNNAFHNFRKKLPLLPNIERKGGGLPVCVVGSGPSLDKRIDDLKKLEARAVVISSGTAIRALWKHGIKPDIHVELESDYSTFELQNMLDDKEFFSGIKLIGAAQLNPNMFDLFEEAYLFFKADGTLAKWFNPTDAVIANAAPTCTNAALALVFHFGFKDVFLFGLDYGFEDKECHHSRETVYYSNSTLQNQSDESHRDTISVPAAAGGSLWTTSFLYTSKRRIENLLDASAAHIFNCSDGASIEKTRWLSSETLASIGFSELTPKQEFLSLFDKQAKRAFSEAEIERVKKKILTDNQAFIGSVADLLVESSLVDKRSFSIFCYKLDCLLQALAAQHEAYYFFIRGAVWHFLLAAYTHVFSIESTPQQADYLTFWRAKFETFLQGLVSRINRVLENTLDSKFDEMANKPIWEVLSDELNWLLAESDWEFQGYKVDEKGVSTIGLDFEFKNYSIIDGRVKG